MNTETTLTIFDRNVAVEVLREELDALDGDNEAFDVHREALDRIIDALEQSDRIVLEG